LLLQLSSCRLERPRLPARERSVPRRPLPPAVLRLEGREERPVGEPDRLLRRSDELLEAAPELRRRGGAEAIPGRSEDLLFPARDGLEVDLDLREPGDSVERFPQKESLLDQPPWGDEERIAAERGKTSIG